MLTFRFIKQFFFIFMTFFLSFYINAEQADFFSKLSEKEFATFSDCVTAYCYFNQIDVKDDFEENINNLKTIIPKMPKKYNADDMLTTGDFSLLTAQHLGLKSGLFYLATKTGRYAARELYIIGIIPLNTSEYEKISGLELIEYLQKVVEYEENKISK